MSALPCRRLDVMETGLRPLSSRARTIDPTGGPVTAGAATEPDLADASLRSALDLVTGARFRLVQPGYDPAAVDQLLEDLTDLVIDLVDVAPAGALGTVAAPADPGAAEVAALVLADAHAQAQAIVDHAEAQARELVASATRSVLAAVDPVEEPPAPEAPSSGADARPEAADLGSATVNPWSVPTVFETIPPGAAWGDGEGLAIANAGSPDPVDLGQAGSEADEPPLLDEAPTDRPEAGEPEDVPGTVPDHLLSEIRADDIAFLEGLRRAVRLELRSEPAGDGHRTEERP